MVGEQVGEGGRERLQQRGEAGGYERKMAPEAILRPFIVM